VNRQDTALLLGMCAAYDQRTIGDADALAWHEILSDLDFEDAKLAVVAHYRTETRRVMPADIRAAVKKIRAERVTHPDEIPDADPDDVPAYVTGWGQGPCRDGSVHPRHLVPGTGEFCPGRTRWDAS
jgi:Asp-tRNA(Asn)/Glu-tRNA(Gln) amidotransferase A subunit family amidase